MKAHFLPLGYVVNQNSESTKIRIVTDSSCRDSNGLTLNMCQKSGKSFVGDLRATLLLSRFGEELAVGDISKFFNQFQLSYQDQSLRRILIPRSWHDKDSTFDVYCESRMPFGDKAAAPLAVIGRVKNAQKFLHLADQDLQPLIQRALIHSSYVDDILVPAKSSDDMERIITSIDKIIEAGGFSIKEWLRSGEDIDPTKLLGYKWYPKVDDLGLKLQINLYNKDRGEAKGPDLTMDNICEQWPTRITKRQCLKIVAQVFDPLLLYAPLVLRLRLLYSEACNEPGVNNWESPISEFLTEKLRLIVICLLDCGPITFPRNIVPKASECTQGSLLIAVDASAVACAAVAYWRQGPLNKPGICRLVTSNIKITGKGRWTIPRLELHAAVMGAQLYARVIENVKASAQVSKVIFFSDSTVVLHQIAHDAGNYDLWSGQRIQKIQSLTQTHSWLHIPSELNPADLATRDLADKFTISSIQWKDGSFFGLPLQNWPESVKKVYSTKEDLIDLPGARQRIITADYQDSVSRITSFKVNVFNGKISEIDHTTVLDSLYRKYTSFLKVQRVVAVIMNRFPSFRNLPFATRFRSLKR